MESTRTAAAEAVRADDRNEVEHQTARAARQRVASDRMALAAELEEVRRSLAELDDRIDRDTARAVLLRDELPALESARLLAAEQAAAARDERKRIDERIAEAAHLPVGVGGPLRPAWSSGAGPHRAAARGRAAAHRARRRAGRGR